MLQTFLTTFSRFCFPAPIYPPAFILTPTAVVEDIDCSQSNRALEDGERYNSKRKEPGLHRESKDSQSRSLVR